MMNLTIRNIEPQDDQTMGEIVQSSLKNRGLAISGTAYFDPYLFHLSEVYKAKRSDYWVLEKNGKIIGGGGFGPFGQYEKIGELQKLYILDEEQGNGYAHTLMKQIIETAKQDYEALYIETFKSLDTANQLYLKYEFVSLSHPLEGSEHGACDTWLLKNLSK